MSFLKRILGIEASAAPSGQSDEQAVLVYLDGTSLPDDVYAEYDVVTLEDRLTQIISDKSLGEYDGDEFGPKGVTLFMYGPNAQRLFEGIEPVIRSYPLCQNARVVIRGGPPGAPETEITVAGPSSSPSEA